MFPLTLTGSVISLIYKLRIKLQLKVIQLSKLLLLAVEQDRRFQRIVHAIHLFIM